MANVQFGPPPPPRLDDDGNELPPREMPDMRLLQKTDLVLVPVFYKDDGSIAATADFYFEFNTDDSGEVASFELRTPKDSLWMKGSKTN